MRIVVQRVKEASVSVDGRRIAAIGKGLLLLVGIGKGDTQETVQAMAGKIVRLRVFEDEQGKMNLDVKQASGEILSVSQFTLYGNIKKGNRPGFDDAAEPGTASILWEEFNKAVETENVVVKKGEFKASMMVSLVNDGPVTFFVDSRKN